MKQFFTIGCFGVILRNKKILLVHRRDYDVWVMPGGGIEKSESLKECVKREVFEETGYRVSVGPLTGIYFKPKRSDLIFTFLCDILSGRPRLNKEAQAIEFFPVNRLPRNMPANTKERIRDASRFKGKPFIKTQLTSDIGKFKKFLLKKS